VVHDPGPPAHAGDRQPAADDLPEHEQVGLPAVLARGGETPVAGLVHAEPGQHLVEDHQRPVLAREPAQARVEALAGGDHTHVGGRALGDDGGDPAGVGGEGLLHGGEVVVGQHQGLGRGGRGDPGGAGQGEGRHAGARLGQQGVHVPVVAPGELHDEVPAGHAARQADRGHGRLGPGRDHAQLVDRADPLDHEFGQLGLPAGRGPEGQAALHGLVHGLDDGRVGVPDEGGPPRADEVDVLAAVDVGEVRALGRGDEGRGAAHGREGPHRGVDPAGHDLARAVEEFLGNAHGFVCFLPPGVPARGTVGVRRGRSPRGTSPRARRRSR